MERPPVEPMPRLQSRFQDTFESARRRPLEASGQNGLPTNKAFQGRVQEPEAKPLPMAQSVKQADPTYKAFWKDSQDFEVGGKKQPQLTVPEPARFGAAAAETEAPGGKAAAAGPEKADSVNETFKELKAAGAAGAGGGGHILWLMWLTARR